MAAESEIKSGNLYSGIGGEKGDEEELKVLLERGGNRVERIVSYGTETGWYDQNTVEFVALLRGSARLQFEGEKEERKLVPGSFIYIPKHAKHRVTATAQDEPTVWLAFHLK